MGFVFPGGSVKATRSAVAARNIACLVSFQPRTPQALIAKLGDTTPRVPLACGLLHTSPLATTPGAAEGSCRKGQHHKASRLLLSAEERAHGAMARKLTAGEPPTPFFKPRAPQKPKDNARIPYPQQCALYIGKKCD